VALRAVIPTASYRAIEAGRWKPTGSRLAALERVLGSTAPDTTQEPRPEWVEALQAEVAAIHKVVDAMATLQAAEVDRLGEVLGRLPLPDADPGHDPVHLRQGETRDQ
jgi:hypothetical protein